MRNTGFDLGTNEKVTAPLQIWWSWSQCVLCVVAVLCSVVVTAQEPEAQPVFSCGKAVELSIDRKPAFHWQQLPDKTFVGFTGSETHAFNVTAEGPFSRIVFYLAATINEEPTGSNAELTAYAVTTSTGTPGGADVEKIWKLAPEQTSLRFDVRQVAECFHQRSGSIGCSFADIKRAAAGDSIPLFDISFHEDLGGANAVNTQMTHLLLDFRNETPAVAVTAECTYNEGGGACTAFDSAQMNRSDLGCEWTPERRDFVCRENSDTGHESFYLIGGGVAPVAGEEASLADATPKLVATPSRAVTVRGIGEVRVISELTLGKRQSVLLLGAPGAFYLVPRAEPHSIRPVSMHPLTGNTKERAKAPEASPLWAHPTAGETPDEKPTYSARELYRDEHLTVLQVVSKTTSNRLYWVGIEGIAGRTVADVIELAGAPSSYQQCGVEVIPESLTAIHRISRPFRASVELQPPTETSVEEDITWKGEHSRESEEPPITNCLREGTIEWRKGSGFVAEIASSECAKPTKPQFVTVTDDGGIKLSDTLTPR